MRPRPPREAYDREHGLLFASGYNDRLLLRAGQLERWLRYLADNPRRLLMLAPWEHHNDRRKITAAQCQSLNLMAHALCAENPSRL